MSSNEKTAALAAGFVIDARRLFGSEHAGMRKEMLSSDCRMDSKTMQWVCPSAEVRDRFLARLDGRTIALPAAAAPSVGAATAQQELAQQAVLSTPALPPPPAAPPPAAVNAQPKAAQPKAEPSPTGMVVKTGNKLLALPPSFVVTQEVGVRGSISYETLDETHGSREREDTVVESETARTVRKVVVNPEEHKAAQFLAGQLRQEVRRLGRVLQSGVLLVPVALESELEAAIASCRERAYTFNSTASHHFVRVSILKALLTSDAEAAARDMAFRVQEFLDEVRSALDSCDPKRIADLASQSKSLIRILPQSDSAALAAAVSSAQQAGRYIKRELEAKVRDAAAIRRSVDTSVVDVARARFLEYEAPPEVAAMRASAGRRFSGLLTESPAAAADGAGTGAASGAAVPQARFAAMG